MTGHEETIRSMALLAAAFSMGITNGHSAKNVVERAKVFERYIRASKAPEEPEVEVRSVRR